MLEDHAPKMDPLPSSHINNETAVLADYPEGDPNLNNYIGCWDILYYSYIKEPENK